MTKPAKIKLTIYQGATFRKSLLWLDADAAPIDLTDCTARMQARERVQSPVPLLSLTTENGGITLGGAEGTIELYLSDADTSAIDWLRGVWDLEIAMPSGDVIRYAQGAVVVSPEVTRD